MSKNWWSNAAAHLLVNLWIFLQSLELLLVFFCNCRHGEAHLAIQAILIHLGLDSQYSHVWPLDMIRDLFIWTGISIVLLLWDTHNSHDLDPVSWSALISQLPVDCEHNVSWHLTSWDQFWRLLELQNLLVTKLRFICIELVRVHWAICFLISRSWHSWLLTEGWSHSSGKTEVELNNLFMTTIGAGIHTLSGSDVALAGRCDNSGNANEFSDQVALEITDHYRILITVNLQLELWARLHVCIVLIIVVDLVNCFDGRLENFDVLSWIRLKCIMKLLIKCI